MRHKRPYWAITDNEERLRAAYRLHQHHQTADKQYSEEHLEELKTDEMEEVQWLHSMNWSAATSFGELTRSRVNRLGINP